VAVLLMLHHASMSAASECTGGSALLDIAKGCSTLRLGKADGTLEVLRDVADHGNCSSLSTVDIHDVQVGEAGGKNIASLLSINTCPHLETIRLIAIGLGDDGAAALADALASNTHVKVLDLRRNGIGDVGSSQLAYALSANSGSRITDINIDGNLVGVRGALAWASVLRNHAVLTHLTVFSASDLAPESAAALAPPLAPEEHAHFLGLAVKYGLERACGRGAGGECRPPCKMLVAAGLAEPGRGNCDAVGVHIMRLKYISDGTATDAFLAYLRNDPTAIIVRAVRLRWGREAEELASTEAALSIGEEKRKENKSLCTQAKVVPGKAFEEKMEGEKTSKTFDSIDLSGDDIVKLKFAVAHSAGIYVDPGHLHGSSLGDSDDLVVENTVLVVAVNTAYLKCKAFQVKNTYR